MIPSEFDRIVYSPGKNRGGQGRRIHAPGRTDDEPLCKANSHNDKWTGKPASVFPDGYLPDCKECLKIIERRRDE